MKKIILLCCFSIPFQISFAQETKEEIITVTKKDTETKDDVPFRIIENPPIYPGCEVYESNGDKKKCMSQKIQKHVAQNFNMNMVYDIQHELTSGVHTIYVQFNINKEGLVDKIYARANHKKLEEEGRRVIAKLPKHVPGKLKGNPVNVSYTIPIKFKLEEPKPIKKKKNK